MPDSLSDRLLKPVLFAVFICSGFSGLIYESIWSHYLKLMLGHAAYAQTLVLAIFMGGMALGAWLASRYSRQWSKPLLVYAGAELAVGLMALGFHVVFKATLDLLFEHWLPGLESPFAADLLKWGIGALLILPQSVLLGTTFPLMAAGFIRLFPGTPGAELGLLYFANSLGAAAGVLVSVFWLIPAVGLPGTMMTAGLINAFLALVVLALAKEVETAPLEEMDSAQGSGAALLKPLLVIALCSSLASFFYEIGWIRMLSLVLGSSVQAFEMMLSAFILGLAFGGLWIRRRLDRIGCPLRYAGHVQMAMGLCALATLPLYLASFDFMAFLIQSLRKNDGGYVLFNLGSHAVAMAVMLPATFAAGMTLPLFTYALLRQGGGERSIGRVYSANTVGAIVGVLLAVHWLMPAVGVKGLVCAGALLDIVVGVALLMLSGARLWRFELPLGAGLAGLVLLAALGLRFDPLLLSSGVFRLGFSHQPADITSLYYQDGKTASVALNQDSSDGRRIILTNGKPDASVQMRVHTPAPDEITQAMAGALPLSLRPTAKSAAVIGFGSGMTAHTLLGARTLERVDIIEIERAIVEGARGFGQKVERAYNDPRGHIHIDDAKTYFSSHNARYDLIVSEPSNPWVSGVAGLFSEEFYRHVKPHLKPGGVLVQWVQLYETNPLLLASVFKALSKQFAHYVVFSTSSGDILIVAGEGRDLDTLDGWIFDEPGLRQDLARMGLASVEELRAKRIGGEALLGPMFAAAKIPANSDYFPYLAHNAPKARYLDQNAFGLSRLRYASLPLLEMLDQGRPVGQFVAMPKTAPELPPQPHPAWAAVESLLSVPGADAQVDKSLAVAVQLIKRELLGNPAPPLADELAGQSLFAVATAVNPFVPAERARQLWDLLMRQPSFAQLSENNRQWLTLYRAVGLRDGKAMGDAAKVLIAQAGKENYSAQQNEYLLSAALAGYLAAGDAAKAVEAINLYRQQQKPLGVLSTPMELLVDLAAAKLRPDAKAP